MLDGKRDQSGATPSMAGEMPWTMWRRTLAECEPEVRALLVIAEWGMALILVGVITLLW